MKRRETLKKIAGGAIVTATVGSMSNRLIAAENQLASKLKGRINHSVCQWCYGSIPLEDLCKAAKKIGLQSIELLNPPDFAMVKKYDLTCAMVSAIRDGYGINKGWNRVENHGRLSFFRFIRSLGMVLSKLLCISNPSKSVNVLIPTGTCSKSLSEISKYFNFRSLPKLWGKVLKLLPFRFNTSKLVKSPIFSGSFSWLSL